VCCVCHLACFKLITITVHKQPFRCFGTFSQSVTYKNVLLDSIVTVENRKKQWYCPWGDCTHVYPLGTPCMGECVSSCVSVIDFVGVIHITSEEWRMNDIGLQVVLTDRSRVDSGDCETAKTNQKTDAVKRRHFVTFGEYLSKHRPHQQLLRRGQTDRTTTWRGKCQPHSRAVSQWRPKAHMSWMKRPFSSRKPEHSSRIGKNNYPMGFYGIS